MKKIFLVILSLVISIIGANRLEAAIIGKSTIGNVPSSLNSFYNQLVKTYIYNTNKFNCSSSGCSEYSREVIRPKFGSVYESLPTPERSNAEFLGWYTSVNDGELVTNLQTHYLYARWLVCPL